MRRRHRAAAGSPGFPEPAARTTHVKPFNLSGVIDDSYGHGTHCAGLICGPPAPNKAPRYGVAPGVELFVANVFGKAYETTVDTLISALEWAMSERCDIVSMSLFKAVDPEVAELTRFREIFTTALDQGTMLVACTGNMSDRASNSVVSARFPASIPEVLAVGGVTRCRTMLNISNSGGDVVAPGDYTWSAYHTNFRYSHLEGTSIATAHAAGIAAQHAQVSGKRGRDLLPARDTDGEHAGAAASPGCRTRQATLDSSRLKLLAPAAPRAESPRR